MKIQEVETIYNQTLSSWFCPGAEILFRSYWQDDEPWGGNPDYFPPGRWFCEICVQTPDGRKHAISVSYQEEALEHTTNEMIRYTIEEQFKALERSLQQRGWIMINDFSTTKVLGN